MIESIGETSGYSPHIVYERVRRRLDRRKKEKMIRLSRRTKNRQGENETLALEERSENE